MRRAGGCHRLLIRAPKRLLSANGQSPPPAVPQERLVAYQDFGTRRKSRILLYTPVEMGAEDRPFIIRQLDDVHAGSRVNVRPFLEEKPGLLLPVKRGINACIAFFLPKNYPQSVTPNYWNYTKWTITQNVIQAISGVLSTQSLLFAVGLGANAAIPAAAALNWVIKDGLGQAGGALFASYASTKFDADPKKWRMISAYAMNISTGMEILTPLVPAFFLPLASIANFGKNVSWMTASATRASIHRSFLREENMADVTAKAGAQSTASSVLGMGLGIVLSTIIGHETANVFSAFLVLAVFQLFATYQSMCAVTVPTLNNQRLTLTTLQFIEEGRIDDPFQVSAREKFVLSWRSPLDRHSSLSLTAPLIELAPTPARLAALLKTYQGDRYFLTARPIAFSQQQQHSEQQQQRKRRPLRQRLRSLLFGQSGGANGTAEVEVLVAFHEGAGPEDVLLAFLHATKLRVEIDRLAQAAISEVTAAAAAAPQHADTTSSQQLSPALRYLFARHVSGHSSSAVSLSAAAEQQLQAEAEAELERLVEATRQFAHEKICDFLAALQEKGWTTAHLLLEEKPARIVIQELQQQQPQDGQQKCTV